MGKIILDYEKKGQEAFEQGYSRKDCPYPELENGSISRICWISGWEKAKQTSDQQSEIAKFDINELKQQPKLKFKIVPEITLKNINDNLNLIVFLLDNIFTTLRDN